MTNKTAITLYGNVGGDPETRTIPGKQVTKQFYDPIIDDMIEREFTTPSARSGPSRSPSARRTPRATTSPAGFAATTGPTSPAWSARVTV